MYVSKSFQIIEVAVQLISEINKKCNPENKEKVQQLSDRLQLLYYSYLATSKVDSHGRITIPQDIVNEYKFKDKIIVQGCGTNLTIFNSKDAYDSYVRKLKTTKQSFFDIMKMVMIWKM